MRGVVTNDFFKPVMFLVYMSLQSVFETIRSFMRGQVEGLKKSFERFCFIKKWSVVVCSFRFVFVSIYRVSEDFKVSLMGRENQTPEKEVCLWDDFLIIEKA